MSVLEQWREWIDAFDTAVEDDNWSRLSAYLADDVVYRVTGAPFATHLRGRDSVLNGLERSVPNFDQRMDGRRWSPLAIVADDTSYVRCNILSEYMRGGVTVLAFQARGHWGFRDGKIDLMLDFYDPQHADVQAALQWMVAHGQDLDPRYSA